MMRLPFRSLGVVWLALLLLTLLSVGVAERTRLGPIAIVLMFAIAAVKGELVMARYMEIGHARRFWRIAYRCWLVAAFLLLAVGHVAG